MAVKKPPPIRPKRAGGTAESRAAQSPPIFRAMVMEALQSWVIPTLSVATGLAFWLLSALDLWPEPVAVVGIAGALLALTMFASFRHYVFVDDARQRWASLVFALAWTLLVFSTFYRFNFPGAPLVSATLQAGEDGISLPVGMLALVIDGRFVSQQTQGNRIGRYRLEVAPAEGTPSMIDGNFEDSFAHQRLGRRGSTVVEIQHTSQRHLLRTTTPGKLRVQDVDASLEPQLRVSVYPGASPWLFPILGVAGIIGALVLEKWWDGDGSATMATAVTFFVIDQYVRWASPHPQLRSLIGAVLIGGIIGAPLAALVWRVVPRRWFAPRR
jgi:hypothetical protein